MNYDIIEGEKMKNKKVLTILLLFVIGITIFTYSYADVGGYDRYDSGGSSYSSGGSSYSSGSSSYSSGGSSSYDDIGSSFGLFYMLLNPWSWPVLFLFVVLFLIGNHGKSKGFQYNIGNLRRRAEPIIPQYDAGLIVVKIKEIDPNFSATNFLAWSKEVYIKLQRAWTKKDWKEIRLFETNELFQQHNAQLKEFIDQKRTNVMERVTVRDAQITDFRVDGDKELIVVTLKAIQIDYIIDDETQELLKGNKHEDRYMKYAMTFVRKHGVKTKEGTNNLNTTNCPNCGAPTQITSSGECEYCHSIITTGEHDWVLANLDGHIDYN
jgi:hypothetical protein